VVTEGMPMGSAQEEGGEGREGRGTGGDWPLPVPTACRRQRAPERARKTTSGARTTKRYRAFPAEFGGSRVGNGPGEANSSGRAVRNST
jgi:hypothetical protein